MFNNDIKLNKNEKYKHIRYLKIIIYIIKVKCELIKCSIIGSIST